MSDSANPLSTVEDLAYWTELAQRIRDWSLQLGFQAMGITERPAEHYLQRRQDWLAKGYQGDMQYLERHQELRENPLLLQPGSLRVLSFRMNYLVAQAEFRSSLANPQRAFISRYALGRDYHKLLKSRLKLLVKRIEAELGPVIHRPLVDSAPVLERALAEQAGLGWIGKNTLLLHPSAGSFFFLAELLIGLPLPIDPPYVPLADTRSGCGACTACLQICPTQALVAPNQLDARRCISYLTIERHGSIPLEFRQAIGNRVYGCDDCQLICPWNRFAKTTLEAEFASRHGLAQASLLQLFQWSEAQFEQATEGSAIRRLGYPRWLRNLSIGLGNAPACPQIQQALQQRLQQSHPDWLLEHFSWALHQNQQTAQTEPRQQRLIRSIGKLYPD